MYGDFDTGNFSINVSVQQGVDIKKIQYNAKKGVTTVIFGNNEIVMVKKAEGIEHCAYTALTAAIAKHIVGSQRKLQQLADETEVIKKGGK